VQRDLDASAEACTVDGGDGRVGQGADPAEKLVPRAASFDRELARRVRKPGDVGARSEDEGLAREDERGPVALLQPRKQALE
jgi:hypothetical protein